MSVIITRVIKDSVNRTVHRNGLFLVGLLLVLSLINGLLGAGVARWAVSQDFMPGMGSVEPMLIIPPILAAIIAVTMWIATIVVSIATLRVFVSDSTEQLAREHFTRDVGWATVNYVFGSIGFAIVVGVGLIVFVIPGLFLLVTLAFWPVFVAVEDKTFIEGFRQSWVLTRGHRVRLFVLGLVITVITIIVSALFNVGALFDGTLGVVLTQIGGAIASAVTTVFTLAALAAAYSQLNSLSDEGESPPTSEERVSPGDTAGDL